MAYIGAKPTDIPLTGADIEDGTVQIADLAATGTKDATTFLRGDGTFATVSSYTDSDALSLFNASGSAPVYAVRAWVNFDGTGTVAIQSSGNVSSITDHGTGEYTINFTTAMSDVNYCHLVGGSQGVGVGNNGLPVLDLNNAAYKSVSSFRIIFTVGNSPVDNSDINLAFVR